jgi:hypothetical protein
MPARDRKRPFWSRWVWKDWEVKTRDLDPQEYTAYHRLLTYAATCSPDLCSIPDDDVRLARATSLGLKAWRRVRDKVLTFWPTVDPADPPAGHVFTEKENLPRRFNHRLRGDAASFFQLVAGNTARVNRRYNRAATAGSTGGLLRARGSEVRSQKSEESESTHLAAPAAVGASVNGAAKAEWLEGFDKDFYPDYPRKVSPDEARKAWLQMKPWSQANCDAIFSGLARWKSYWTDHETPKDKIPYPASFLRSGQWKGAPE